MKSDWEHPAFEDWNRRRRRRMQRDSQPVPVTQAIVVSTVFVFIFQLIIGLPGNATPFGSLFYTLFMLRGDLLFQGLYLWQPLTHMFLHMGPMHLLFNMVCLFFVGPLLERRVGPLHFLAVYFLGGFAGGLLQVWSSPHALLGASGGVFAVILGFCALNPNRRVLLLLFLIIPIPLRCRTLAIGLIGTSILLQLLSLVPFLAQFGLGGLGHMAHLGGSLLGWGYIRYLRRAHPRIAQQEDFDDPEEFDPVVEARRIDRDDERTAGAPRPATQRVERPRPAGSHFFRTSAGKPFSRGSQSDEDPEFERILDKISREGLHSLTREERDWLDHSAGSSGRL